MLCHYCGYEQEPPKNCPLCGQAAVRYHGLGTEKLQVGDRGAIPRLRRAAHGQRHDASARQSWPRTGGVPRRADPHSARHADDRQGAGFSERDAGRRGQRRRGAARARLPLGGADVSAVVASGGAQRAEGRAAAACWCRRSRRSIRASPWRRRTITPASSAAELTHRRAHNYPPYQRLARVIVRSRDQKAAGDFADRLADASSGRCKSWRERVRRRCGCWGRPRRRCSG